MYTTGSLSLTFVPAGRATFNHRQSSDWSNVSELYAKSPVIGCGRAGPAFEVSYLVTYGGKT